MLKPSCVCLRSCLAISCIVLMVTPLRAITFEEIPGLTVASGISDDGSTIIGTQQTSQAIVAARWRRDSGLDLIGDFPGGLTRSNALDVSADGSVVVGESEFDRYDVVIPPYNDIGEVEKRAAYRWTKETGLQNFFPLTRDTPNSSADNITADGTTVFGFGSSAFKWTESNGIQSTAVGAAGVSADGEVTALSQGALAFRWTEEAGIQQLSVPAGLSTGSGAPQVDVSDNGQVFYGNKFKIIDGVFHDHPYLWTEAGGYIPVLPDLPFRVSVRAYDASSDGELLVGQHKTSGPFPSPQVFRAMMWSQSAGLIFIDDFVTAHGVALNGWQLQNATGVSADGAVIVGTGINPNGQEASWLLHLPIAADFNADGQVDGNDLATWTANYADSPAANADGDANYDGIVDGADFLLWQRQYSTNTQSAGVSVPEPSIGAFVLGEIISLAIVGKVRFRAARRHRV